MRRGIRFHYQLGGIDFYESVTDTNINPNIRKENIILWLDENNEPDQSKWAYKVDVAVFRKLKEFVSGWVELFFPLPPEEIRKSGKFSMIHDIEEENNPFIIYEKVEFKSFYNNEAEIDPLPDFIKTADETT